MQLQYILAIAVPILSGLSFLVYKHPAESRKLISIFLGVAMLIFIIWITYLKGAKNTNAIWLKETNNTKFFENQESLRNNSYDNCGLFMLSVFGGWLILIFLSFFFEELQKKKV